MRPSVRNTKGEEPQRPRATSTTGRGKRERHKEAVIAAAAVSGASGFGPVTDAQRYRARQGLAELFPDDYRSAEDVNRRISQGELPEAHWLAYTRLIAQA